MTTCVHNILGGQRWVDQFGEMTITNGTIVCKLTFTKVSSGFKYEKRVNLNTWTKTTQERGRTQSL